MKGTFRFLNPEKFLLWIKKDNTNKTAYMVRLF